MAVVAVLSDKKDRHLALGTEIRIFLVIYLV